MSAGELNRHDLSASVTGSGRHSSNSGHFGFGAQNFDEGEEREAGKKKQQRHCGTSAK